MHGRKGHLPLVRPATLLQRFCIPSLHQRFHDSRRRSVRSPPLSVLSPAYQTSCALSDSAKPTCSPETGFHPCCHTRFVIAGTDFPDLDVQSVDFTKRNGMGGESIYGSPFADEDLSHELDSHGYVASSHLPVSGARCPDRCCIGRDGHMRPLGTSLFDSFNLVTHLLLHQTDTIVSRLATTHCILDHRQSALYGEQRPEHEWLSVLHHPEAVLSSER
jgi:hypothetical protein